MGYWSGLADGQAPASDKIIKTAVIDGVEVNIKKGIDFYAEIGNGEKTLFGKSVEDLEFRLEDFVAKYKVRNQKIEAMYQSLVPVIIKLASERGIPIILGKKYDRDVLKQQICLLLQNDWFYKNQSPIIVINDREIYISIKDGKTIEDFITLLNFEELFKELKTLRRKPQTPRNKAKIEELEDRLKKADSARFWNS